MTFLIILLVLLLIVDQFHINSLYKDINILYDGLEEIADTVEQAVNKDKKDIK